LTSNPDDFGCSIGTLIMLRSTKTAALIATSPPPTTNSIVVPSVIPASFASHGMNVGTNAATSAPT